MTTDTSNIQPRLTADQALLRLLELIRASKTISDFTPERLSQTMKVPIDPWAKGYGFSGPLTKNWNLDFAVEWSLNFLTRKDSPEFILNFWPTKRDSFAEMTDICQVDFDRFTAELEAMGFSRSHNYDSPPQPPLDEPHLRLPHGRLINDYFDRQGMRVEVYPRGESNDNVTHDCVEMVDIY